MSYCGIRCAFFFFTEVSARMQDHFRGAKAYLVVFWLFFLSAMRGGVRAASMPCVFYQGFLLCSSY